MQQWCDGVEFCFPEVDYFCIGARHEVFYCLKHKNSPTVTIFNLLMNNTALFIAECSIAAINNYSPHSKNTACLGSWLDSDDVAYSASLCMACYYSNRNDCQNCCYIKWIHTFWFKNSTMPRSKSWNMLSPCNSRIVYGQLEPEPFCWQGFFFFLFFKLL